MTRGCLFDSIKVFFLDAGHLGYVRFTYNQVFDITIQEHRPRLVQKFQKHLKEETSSVREPGASLPRKDRINNLSSLVLNGQGISLLSKGPNFAVTQKISNHVILEAEKGVERLAYAVRWQDAKRRSKEIRIDSGTTTPTTIEPVPSEGHPTGSTVQSDSARPTRAVSDATTATTTTTETDAAPAGSIVGADGTGTTTRAPMTDAAASGSPPTQTTNTESGICTSRTGLSFRFPDTDKRFPPPANVEMERKLKQLKDDIVVLQKL